MLLGEIYGTLNASETSQRRVMTVFQQPKEQWKTLLQNRSWPDLCGVDFVHIMERGSTERVKIFITSLMSKREELEQHIPSLSACVNADTFNNGKWNKSKVSKLLNFLLEHNQKCATFEGLHQPYAPLIEAVVRHSDYKTGIDPHDRLLSLAVVRDSDLLDNLLQRMDPNQRSLVAEQLCSNYSNYKRWINMATPKLFFTRTTVELLPEFPNTVIKHMCDDLRWEVATDLSISQRLKRTANNVMSNVMERLVGGYNIPSRDDKTAFDLQRIEQFNRFIELHGEALSEQHWKEILPLFKKVSKKYDVVNVDFLRNHTLKDTLQKDIVDTHESTPSAPPKRKM